MSTKILALDRAIQNTIEWLDDIQTELGWERRSDAYKATKAVLQTIRDRSTIEEVMHLTANLPLIMKGMLLDGYTLREKPVKLRDADEFLLYVQANYDSQGDIIDAEEVVEAVAAVLTRRMGGGEIQKIASTMPHKIRRLFQTAPEAETASGKTEIPVY
ncbi:MAG: DUF2267 domain-containing protein [Candidatus Bathyarchaeota archaeon]|nr:DUF2267 domain-containing protein [Candidatus Bathyarchaeota archaeon]